MKITVINGTEKKGVTYQLKEMFLEEFQGKAEITEFYLPRDCPNFCVGCIQCFGKGEQYCKDYEYISKIEKALKEADLIVFTSPTYVFHTTGAMKAMLDHFGYRWMPHRPAGWMFGKRAMIITQALGSGEKSAAKDIRDSLSWWGITHIKTASFKLLSEVRWEKIPEKRRAGFSKRLHAYAKHFLAIDYSKPARAGIMAKAKFHVIRKMQMGLGKQNPEYTDYKYWKSNGWIEKTRPW